MPPILAGILGIYGLVVSVVITSLLNEKSALHTNFLFLASGIAVGLSCVGDAGVRATGQQPRMFVGMMMMLIFAEVLGELCPLFSSVVRELEEV
jgi:V-type H+-transporting ATPase proteolipid subunit